MAVSGIAASRFYVPPAMLQRILLAADPVVLSDGEQLRVRQVRANWSRWSESGGGPAA